MKKAIVFIFVTALTLLVFTGCKNEKYADYREFLDESMTHMTEYMKKMEAVKDVQDLIDALNWHYENVIKIVDKSKVLVEKYPEVTDENPPAELKPYFDKITAIGEELDVKTVSIFAKYIDDKRVMDIYRKILEKLREQ